MTNLRQTFRTIFLFYFRHYIYIYKFLNMTTIAKVGQFQTSAAMQVKKQMPTRDTCSITYTFGKY